MGVEVETRIAEGWVRGAIVGAGASGTVSLAMIRSSGQLFAVKSTTGFSLALDDEYQILRRLDSPYIVRCLGRSHSVENGAEVHNLFMEYMPGGCISDLVTKFGGRLDESVIRVYTRDILHGIHYLHRQGIVHCDIKGKNVLVGANGVKLADFGSAKRLGDEKKGLEDRNLRGTLLWMAPEVVNQVGQGPASDIWSLACTVLEMATGRHPWSQVSNPLAAMYRIGCTEELPELPASLSLQIRDFLEKCFRRDPKKRWTSAELLNHPFLNDNCCTPEKVEVVTVPGSPTSNLDFGNQVWDSFSCQSTAILSLSVPTPIGQCNADLNGSIKQCPGPSPRGRVMALAAGCKFEDVGANWSANPPGQWIIVRSSRSKSPTSDLLSNSDSRRGSFSQDLSSSSEASNSKELQPRGSKKDEFSDSSVSATQVQHDSSSSAFIESLQGNLPYILDEAWELYGNSSLSIPSSDPGIHNTLRLREPLYVLDDKCSSITEAIAVCCTCSSSICITQFCHTIMTKAQLYISSLAIIFPCKFEPKLFPIDFIWSHTQTEIMKHQIQIMLLDFDFKLE